MIPFLARRLAGTLLVLLSIAILTFFLIHEIPGSPWDRQAGRRALANSFVSQSAIDNLNRRFGLDLPLWQQFTRYLIGYETDDGWQCGYLCGHFGPSMFQQGRSIEEILFEPPENAGFWKSRFGYTLRLAGFALLITLIVGLPLGIYSAARRKSAFDVIASIFMAVGMSVPNFVLGLLLIIVFASNLHLINVRPDWNSLRDWIVPAVVLAITPTGMLARITRTAVLDVQHGDYVRTARSKGLDEPNVMIVHIIKNAAIPVLTHLGPVLFELIAASFVIEVMFGFPGFGREYFSAITRLDYPMIMALTLLYGVFIAIANLLTDVLYVALDPRIRID